MRNKKAPETGTFLEQIAIYLPPYLPPLFESAALPEPWLLEPLPPFFRPMANLLSYEILNYITLCQVLTIFHNKNPPLRGDFSLLEGGSLIHQTVLTKGGNKKLQTFLSVDVVA